LWRKPIFDHYGIEEELKKSMQSKVWLKNGACIVIEQTEALVSIDVNSGKFIGKKDHETNSMKINLGAAREIARQARLRDLGGLIIIDFIDVLQPENKKKIYTELKREFHKDRSITKIEEVSRFGLIEMTRQRIRPSVLNAVSEECPQCQGTGLIPSLPSVIADLERWIQRYRSGRGDRRITLRIPPGMYDYLNKGKFSRRMQLMWKYWMKLSLYKDTSLDARQFKIFDKKNEEEIVLK
jgi:ribonuclease G